MKRPLYLFLGLAMLLGIVSCGGPDGGDVFDKTLIYGKLQEGSVYERYEESYFKQCLSNGDTVLANGKTWDISEDVNEDEAQVFEWTLEGSTLQQTHLGTFVVVPKVYTVTTLTEKELVYSDNYGTTHSFSKVE